MAGAPQSGDQRRSPSGRSGQQRSSGVYGGDRAQGPARAPDPRVPSTPARQRAQERERRRNQQAGTAQPTRPAGTSKKPSRGTPAGAARPTGTSKSASAARSPGTSKSASAARSPGTSKPAGAARPGAGSPPGRPPKGPDRGKEQPPERPHRRTPLWAKLTLAVGAVLMLLSGTALAGYEVLNNRYAGNVQTENLLGESAVDPGQELVGPLNLLMLGLDEQGEGARSDTIIVLHIPSSHDQAYLMSVPRDTFVTVPGYWDMKITDAFNVGYENNPDLGGGWGGGAQMVASILNNLTDLRFNGAAIVNFGGFRNIIDEMGGLEFCVDTEAYSEHLVLVDGEPMNISKAKREGHWDYEQVTYEVGCQHMEGWQALDYARQRKTLASGEGDYGRQRHQVQLLHAMAAKATSSDVTANLSTLDSLILAAGEALIVDTNDVPLADFAFTLRNLRPGDLITLQTNRGEYNSAQVDGSSVERLTPESIEMFRAAANDTLAEFVIRHPEFLAPEQSAQPPGA